MSFFTVRVRVQDHGFAFAYYWLTNLRKQTSITVNVFILIEFVFVNMGGIHVKIV